MVNKTKCREAYPTDLTDKQWAEIAPLFAGMHKQKWDKRELVNAVFYLVKNPYLHLVPDVLVFIGN